MASSQPRPSFWNRQLKDARPFDLLKAETWRLGKARWTANYYVKHIRPGSLKPVLHFFVFGIFAWQYALQWKTLHGMTRSQMVKFGDIRRILLWRSLIWLRLQN